MRRSRPLLAAASLAMAVGFAECSLRAAGYPHWGCWRVGAPAEAAVTRFDADLGWAYVPGRFAIGDHGAVYAFAAEGFRAATAQDRVDFSKPRILVLGDSMLFGHGLDFADTFGAKLETALGGRYQVLNFAVQGYGTDQTYLFLQRLLDRLAPAAVVVDFLGEHLARNVSADRRELFRCLRFPGTKPRFALQDGELRLLETPQPYAVYDDPRLGLLLRRAREGSLERRMRRDGVPLTRALMAEMARLARSRGARFYLIGFADDETVAAINPGAPTIAIDLQRPEHPELHLSPEDRHPSARATTLLVAELLDRMERDLR